MRQLFWFECDLYALELYYDDGKERWCQGSQNITQENIEKQKYHKSSNKIFSWILHKLPIFLNFLQLMSIILKGSKKIIQDSRNGRRLTTLSKIWSNRIIFWHFWDFILMFKILGCCSFEIVRIMWSFCVNTILQSSNTGRYLGNTNYKLTNKFIVFALTTFRYSSLWKTMESFEFPKLFYVQHSNQSYFPQHGCKL